jgi:hypothetical protein
MQADDVPYSGDRDPLITDYLLGSNLHFFCFKVVLSLFYLIWSMVLHLGFVTIIWCMRLRRDFCLFLWITLCFLLVFLCYSVIKHQTQPRQKESFICCCNLCILCGFEYYAFIGINNLTIIQALYKFWHWIYTITS